MRKQICISKNWKYLDRNVEGFEKINFKEDDFISVDLPHTNKMLPYNYFSDTECCFISNYRKTIKINKIIGKRYRIVFEGISNYAKLYVNGKYVAEDKCGYLDFDVDITDYIVNGENQIAVLVDSTEKVNIPPFGNVIDYLTYGGIYRDVYLIEVDECYIKDVYLHSSDLLNNKDLIVDISLSKVNGKSEDVEVYIFDDDKLISKNKVNTSSSECTVNFTNLSIELWSIDNPKLYEICVKTKTDNIEMKYGFRTCNFTTSGFYLNGERVQLIGLDRHQSFPYVGYAMGQNSQEEDAIILKDTGVNLVRCSHYPQSRYFLNKCDELGILVFEEIPGWNYIGDSEWQDVAVLDVKNMILRDRNHPSIILWGVRINESEDNHELYTKTNELAHSLDYRQTAGVRWKPHSEMLEDVFAINDFVPMYEEPPLRDPRIETGKDYDVPYLVTEYMGHMFPTKIFDNEIRMYKHAERHALIQNFAHGDKRISGAIGWCAFDYNTHRNFGTNDKICYHGVMDMFRNPKFASFVYKSQKDVKDGLVMEFATNWSFGERDIGGVCPLFIYTNLDSVEMIPLGKEGVMFYPDKENFPNLVHPPVVVRQMSEVWGSDWKDVEFVGYLKGEKVLSKKYTANPIPSEINLELKSKVAYIDDCIRLFISVNDNFGNPMKFWDEPLFIDVKGGVILGPNVINTHGGMISVWIKVKGDIEVSVKSQRLNEVKLFIKSFDDDRKKYIIV